MKAGLQLFDRLGRLVIDTPTYTTKLLADLTFASDQNSAIDIPKHPNEQAFITVFNFSNRNVTLTKVDHGSYATVSWSTPDINGNTTSSGFVGWFRILYGLR